MAFRAVLGCLALLAIHVGIASAQSEVRGQVAIELRVVSTTLGQDYLLERGISSAQANGIPYAVLSPRQLFEYELALQRDRSSSILILPKVTAFEGQESTLKVGDFVLRTGINFNDGGEKAPALKDEKIFLGTEARFVSAIAADGRTVTMKIKMQTRKHLDLPAAVKPPQANPANAPDADPPTHAEFKLAVNAKIPDDRTVAFFVGKELADIPMEPLPPVSATIARIPYVNRLFRNQVYGRTAKAVVFLITPHIIRDLDTVSVEALRGEPRTVDDEKPPVGPASR